MFYTDFMKYCRAFNQPIRLSKNLISIGYCFMQYCASFNQPLELPYGLQTIGHDFFSTPSNGSAPINRVFNYPVVIPDTVTSIDGDFLEGLTAFNSPVKLSKNLTSLGGNFLRGCTAFDQDVTIPAGVTDIGGYFLAQTDMSTSQAVFEGTIRTIGYYFLAQTKYNAELPFKEGLEEVGTFCLYAASRFNQPIIFPSTLKKFSLHYFLYAAYYFNQPIDWDFLDTIDCGTQWNTALGTCLNYNYPIKIPSSITELASFGNTLVSMTYDIVIPRGVKVVSGSFFYQQSSTSRTYGFDPATTGFSGTVIFEDENPAITTTATNVLGADANDVRVYIEGIKIAGPGAEAVKEKYPDKDDKSPYRKLIIVDDPRE